MQHTEPTITTRRARRANSKPAVTAAAPAKRAAPMVSADERRSLIAEHAYLRAERRGFSGGDPVTDWLESEREVDTLLARSMD